MKKNSLSSVTESTQQAITDNPWQTLNAFTDARVGLGRSGISLPTKHLLAFQLAHAQAIDAVHARLDSAQLADALMQQDWATELAAPLLLNSRAADRATYLQRPDYGRLLDQASAQKLAEHSQHPSQASYQGYDLAIAIIDGLSSLAIEQNALPFLNALFSNINIHQGDITEAPSASWNMAPLCIVEQGRVAIGDDICQRLNARCVLVLIGERPGLSSPDSLGLYLTWGAKVGYTDAYRNCISNVRPAGLAYQEAAHKTSYLLNQARTLKLSGVKLKDRSDADLITATVQAAENFLVG